MNQQQTPGNDRPILDEAKRKSLIAVGGTIVSAALSFGIITPELAERLNTSWAYILGAVITVLPLATSALHALGIIKAAEPKTTPVDSPTDHAGNPLVPLPHVEADQLDEPEPPPALVETTGEPMPVYDPALDEDTADANGDDHRYDDTPDEREQLPGRHRDTPANSEDTTTIPPVT